MSEPTFFDRAPWREQMLEGGRTVVWFSCGAASAVAAKLTLTKYRGVRPVHLVYTDTRSEDYDNYRFMHDCERWFSHEVEIVHSDQFEDVDDVVAQTRFLRGPKGARCTGVLKRLERHKYQRAESDIQVFGFDARPREVSRAARFAADFPEVNLETPLIEAGLTHADCLAVLRAVSITEPRSYRLGFKNANCPGCLKAEGAGYWNMVRRHYPSVFSKRAKQERELGYALCRVKGKPVFLDELAEDVGEYEAEQDVECGALCQDVIQEACE